MPQLLVLFLTALVAISPATAPAAADLESRITAIAAKVPATFGIAALDLETSRRVSVRGGDRFPMGSVFKFPVALAFLPRVDKGDFSLDASVTIEPKDLCPVGFSPIRDNANGKAVTTTYGALLQAMLRDSDNTAADFLLAKIGGPRAVTERMRALGAPGVRVDRSEREIGVDLDKPGGIARYATDPRDTATPDAAIALLGRVHRAEDGLSAASHALALKLMIETTRGNNRIKALLPAGTVVAHRPGTMPGTANDIGIVTSAAGTRHVLIAIFTKSSKTEDLAPRERAIAEIAKAICDDFWQAGQTH
jgi:beta-lactamase class A